METSVYSFDEADGMIEVCARLTAAPDDGLECSIVATLQPVDGPKAGEAKSEMFYHLLY